MTIPEGSSVSASPHPAAPRTDGLGRVLITVYLILALAATLRAVYQIVAKDTIEERILNLQRSKTDLAQRFVDSASSATGRSMAALTKDDLLALLG